MCVSFHTLPAQSAPSHGFQVKRRIPWRRNRPSILRDVEFVVPVEAGGLSGQIETGVIVPRPGFQGALTSEAHTLVLNGKVKVLSFGGSTKRSSSWLPALADVNAFFRFIVPSIQVSMPPAAAVFQPITTSIISSMPPISHYLIHSTTKNPPVHVTFNCKPHLPP